MKIGDLGPGPVVLDGDHVGLRPHEKAGIQQRPVLHGFRRRVRVDGRKQKRHLGRERLLVLRWNGIDFREHNRRAQGNNENAHHGQCPLPHFGPPFPPFAGVLGSGPPWVGAGWFLRIAPAWFHARRLAAIDSDVSSAASSWLFASASFAWIRRRRREVRQSLVRGRGNDDLEARGVQVSPDDLEKSAIVVDQENASGIDVSEGWGIRPHPPPRQPSLYSFHDCRFTIQNTQMK
jgi:hypothetical protein